MGRFFSSPPSIATYMLVACVLGLWGIIFFRIFTASADNESRILKPQAKKPIYFKLVDHQYDPIIIDLSYRDPFSSAAYSPVLIQENPLAGLGQRSTVEKPPVDWSSIRYTGYINNKNTKQQLAIIAIKGRDVMLGVGQQEEGLKLLTFSADSIRVSYQQVSRFIKLR